MGQKPQATQKNEANTVHTYLSPGQMVCFIYSGVLQEHYIKDTVLHFREPFAKDRKCY